MRASLALLFAAGTLAAQNTSRLSKPVEFWNPHWSPDGTSIVFEATLSGKYSIYTIRPDGSGLLRLTPDTANSEQPNWSPDGRRIVFSSDRGGSMDIFAMAADGSAQAQLTRMGGGGWYNASFSPDGRWIVFQGRPNNAQVRDQVYVMRADGSELRLLSDSSYGAEGPRWSSDGRSVEFNRVPYPVRLWSEMGPAEMNVARKGETRVAVPLAGGPPVTIAKRAKVSTAGVPDDAQRSPDGKRFTWSKAVDGWAGLYAYDVATRQERLLIGGRGAGPLGYLRTAALDAFTDTVDTYESPRSGGPVVRGNGAVVISTMKQIGGGRWELVDTWFDSTGRETARQSLRTARGSLVTELEYTRALTDSASMSYTRDRTTGWVVPAGRPVQLFDGPSTGERYAGAVALAAIAKSKPLTGAVFVAPAGAMYGGNPLATRVDTIRVAGRDTLYRGSAPIPVFVMARGQTQLWIDEATGVEVASRGNAGPEKYWWHVRRGVRVPGGGRQPRERNELVPLAMEW